MAKKSYNFKFKNCLFGVTNIVKNSDKEKYVYSGYGITFDSAGSWSFDNDTARDVIIFGVDNSSSSHADNRKNNFLMLGDGPTFGINGSFGSLEKKFSINFSKANTKFCLSFHYSDDNSYLFVNGKEIFKFKANNKNVNFPTQFCLGSISNEFSATEFREVSLNGNVYDFSVDQILLINGKEYYKIMVSLIKQVFTVLLSFSESLAAERVSLNDESCMVRPTLTDLNPIELKYYPLLISLDKCNGSCNVLSPKMCVLKKKKKRHKC